MTQCERSIWTSYCSAIYIFSIVLSSSGYSGWVVQKHLNKPLFSVIHNWQYCNEVYRSLPTYFMFFLSKVVPCWFPVIYSIQSHRFLSFSLSWKDLPSSLMIGNWKMEHCLIKTFTGILSFVLIRWYPYLRKICNRWKTLQKIRNENRYTADTWRGLHTLESLSSSFNTNLPLLYPCLAALIPFIPADSVPRPSCQLCRLLYCKCSWWLSLIFRSAVGTIYFIFFLRSLI